LPPVLEPPPTPGTSLQKCVVVAVTWAESFTVVGSGVYADVPSGAV
jgi:hypothetical protein